MAAPLPPPPPAPRSAAHAWPWRRIALAGAGIVALAGTGALLWAGERKEPERLALAEPHLLPPVQILAQPVRQVVVPEPEPESPTPQSEVPTKPMPEPLRVDAPVVGVEVRQDAVPVRVGTPPSRPAPRPPVGEIPITRDVVWLNREEVHAEAAKELEKHRRGRSELPGRYEIIWAVEVDTAGRIRAWWLDQSSRRSGLGESDLDRVAKRAIEARARFDPALSGDRPVARWAKIPISFEIPPDED